MVLELLALVLAFTCGWFIHAYVVLRQPTPTATGAPEPPQRRARIRRPGQHCYQVTFAYTDGSLKTFRNCEGFHDFTQTFGRAQAPDGTTLVSRAGGTCDAH
jgi:hypothetical protein